MKLMNIPRSIKLMTAALLLLLSASCSDNNEQAAATQNEPAATTETPKKEGGLSAISLTDQQYQSLDIKTDTLHKRMLSGVIKATGQLEVPPQHEASVTTILGANIQSIKVIEGDKVNKGQVLAYLAHPNLIAIQTEYLKAYQRKQFLEKEYQRQKRLYDAKVGSGKAFQQTSADYESIKGEVQGYEAQLDELDLNPEKIAQGAIYRQVPVRSPISGYIEQVSINTGQYVDPQTKMFQVVNNDHIHADLTVFEKDVHKVKVGQEVSFEVQSAPEQTLSAKIYAVGRTFEQNPKAVHVHAEIKKKIGYLIPGMYINGRIHVGDKKVPALPEEAVVEDNGQSYIFIAESKGNDQNKEWVFRPREIKTGLSDEGWVEIKLLKPLPEGTKIAMNNAYYLIAEMKKGETGED